MTQDQRNLGLIHPCLHKQNENRISAFYHMHPNLRFRKSLATSASQDSAQDFGLSCCVIREALDGKESLGKGGSIWSACPSDQ